MDINDVIPADKWPEWADRHCWDENGRGWFYGLVKGLVAWYPGVSGSEIPLPPGHDWRVPVMRHQPVDLEQFARLANGWIVEAGGPVADAMHACADELLGVISVQSKGVATDRWQIYQWRRYENPQKAPAIDLEQFREYVDVCRQQLEFTIMLCERDGMAVGDVTTSKLGDTNRLLALIDGQADQSRSIPQMELFEAWYGSCDARFWNNWDACYSAFLAGQRSVQPTKGEGVAGG